MSDLQTAIKQHTDGFVDDAERTLFHVVQTSPHDAERYEALLALSSISLQKNEFTDAQNYAEQAVRISGQISAIVALADALGHQGKRRSAAQLLESSLTDDPSHGYGWALLGEQYIRQGLWDEGLAAYTQALTLDEGEGAAFKQLRGVLNQLVKVVREKRIPATDALRFINRLDYSLPDRTPEMMAYFALVRRHIQSVPSPPQPEPGKTGELQKAVPRSQPIIARPVPDAPKPPASARPKRSRTDTRNNTAARQKRPPSQPTSSQLTRQQSHPTAVVSRTTNTGFVQTVRHQRRLNEELQAMVGSLVDAKWPSQTELIAQIPDVGTYGKHDDLQSAIGGSIQLVWPSEMTHKLDTILLDDLSVADWPSNQLTMRQQNFRLTSGDIFVEIIIERSIAKVIQAAQGNTYNTIALVPPSISRLELNYWDGLFEKIVPLEQVYNDDVNISNYHELCMGSFIGECLINTYQGIWQYADPPEQSTVTIGETTVRPFDLAKQWMAAADKDDVTLELLVRQAEQSSRSIFQSRAHVDLLSGLDGRALATKLAELWTSYRFCLGDGVFADVASSIEILSTSADIIVFSIDRRWVPTVALGNNDCGLIDHTKAPIAYLRNDAFFLPLASRKYAARGLEAQFKELTPDNARAVLSFLQRYHRPQWRILHSDALAKRVSSRLNMPEVIGPRLGEIANGTSMRVWVFTGKNVGLWQINYKPGELLPWSLDIVQ